MSEDLFDKVEETGEKKLSWTEKYIFNLFNRLIVDEKNTTAMCSFLILISTIQNLLLLFSATYSFMDKEGLLIAKTGQNMVIRGFRRLAYLASPLDMIDALGLSSIKQVIYFLNLAFVYGYFGLLAYLSSRYKNDKLDNPTNLPLSAVIRFRKPLLFYFLAPILEILVSNLYCTGSDGSNLYMI